MAFLFVSNVMSSSGFGHTSFVLISGSHVELSTQLKRKSVTLTSGSGNLVIFLERCARCQLGRLPSGQGTRAWKRDTGQTVSS